MSYHCLSSTKPKARKDYACIWCPEKILKGEVHVHEVSTYCGDFQDQRWHPECRDAASKYFRESGDDEFSPNECKRGTNEPA